MAVARSPAAWQRLQDGIEAGLSVDFDRSGSGRPVVPAQMLVDVMTTALPSGQPHQALRLDSVDVAGRVNFEYRTLLGPLILHDCHLGDMNFEQATAIDIWLMGCETGEIQASQLNTRYNLTLSGSTCRGEVNLGGAHIGGQLDASGATIINPGANALMAQSCTIQREMFLSEGFSTTGRVSLSGTEVGGDLYLTEADCSNVAGDALDGSGLKVQGGMFMSASSFAGTVTLVGAKVGGDLLLSETRFFKAGGWAVLADQLVVEHEMNAVSVRMRGAMRMRRAQLGALDLSGAHLFGEPRGFAFDGQGLVVHTDLLCSNDFTARGEVNLWGARVGGDLDLSNAVLVHPEGRALQADGMVVERTFTAQGLTASGEVCLREARVSRTLQLDGSLLVDQEWSALDATGISVGQDFRCAITALGDLRLRRAHVTGDLTLGDVPNAGDPSEHIERAVVLGKVDADGLVVDGNAHLCSVVIGDGPLDLRSARVGHALNWEPAVMPGAVVDLRSAAVHRLSDRLESWPRAVHLDGFTYNILKGGSTDSSVPDRLGWLRSAEAHESYKPRVYNQLADAYRRAGNEDAVRRILVEKQRARARSQARRQHGPRRLLTRWGDWFLNQTIGYGMRPGRILRWLLAALVLAWLSFSLLHPDHVIPLKKGAGEREFVPFLFSLDLLLPVANLGQRTAFVTEGPATWASAAFTVSGWLLGAVLVAGIGGVFKRD